jgi:hypothetical protein
LLNSNQKSTASNSAAAGCQNEAVVDHCVTPLGTGSAVGHPVWVEKNAFSLSSGNFSTPFSLFYDSESI